METINTFWELIQEHRIEIPPIQRDYAQGRKNSRAEEIRKSFIKQIKDTLKGGNTGLLHLNFVYGKVNGKINAVKLQENKEAVSSMLEAIKTYSKNLDFDIKWDFSKNESNAPTSEITSFAPLDGQQRLTTLFLLHWYLMPEDEECKKILKKFSYKIRPSSKDFCKALVDHKEVAKCKNLKSAIKDSAWYFEYWNNDPTVRGMLRMLDEIHSAFEGEDKETCWKFLIEGKAICFDFLDLDDYKLTDELYVKMNARGVPLTPFENFKAWLIEYIQEKSITIQPLKNKNGEERNWVELLDTTWTDLFWANMDEHNMLIDEELMRYFRNMMQIFLVQKENFNPENDPKKDENDQENIRAAQQRKLAADLAIKPRGQSEYKYVSNTFFTDNELLSKTDINELFESINNIANNSGILDTIHILFTPIDSFKTDTKGNKYSREVFKDFITGEMSYRDKLLYFALQLYLKQTPEDDEASLKAWMRVVRNLIENSTIDSVPRFKNGVESIKALFKALFKAPARECNNIYQFLNDNPDLKLTEINKKQIEEEARKARLILENKLWEETFLRYENHPYFNGQIGFLLNIAVDDNNLMDIPAFEGYANKMAAIFTGKVKNNESVLFERALLTEKVDEFNDYLYKVDSNYTFGTLYGDKTSWKKTIFTCPKRLKAIRKLLDKVSIETICDDLNKICKSYTTRDWKYELINCPKAINFCSQKLIRYTGNNNISLLKKTRMAGNHAELFSYALYSKIGDRFSDVFNERWYHNGIGSGKKPFGVYRYIIKNDTFEMHLHYDANNLKVGKTFLPFPYELKFFLKKEEVFSENEYDLSIQGILGKEGFQWKGNENTNKKGYWISAETDDKIIDIIQKLATKLGAKSVTE
jgi:hypothetical protein